MTSTKEIRVENTLQDEDGEPVSLKPGAEVEVTIEAEKQKPAEYMETPTDKGIPPAAASSI